MTRTDELLRAQLVDAVMARVEDEPVPTASRAFLAAVRQRAPIQAFTAFATAGRLATLRTRPVPLATRMRAAALALGVGGMLATSGAVALASVAGVAQQVAGHLGGAPVLEPARPTTTPVPSPTARRSEPPTLIIAPAEPGGSEPAHPTPVASPSPSPSPVPTPWRAARPTATPELGGGSGDDESRATPQPTATSGQDDAGDESPDGQATATPEPTATPPSTEGATAGDSSAPDSAPQGVSTGD